MQSRKVLEALKRKKVDAFLVIQKENIAYLCGFYGSLGALLLGDGNFLFVDGRYYIQAKEEAKDCEIVLAKGSFWETVGEFVKNRGIKRLGFEEAHMSYRVYRFLRRKAKGTSFVPLSEIVERERMIKNEWELERMERALRLSEEAISHCLGIIKDGMSERDLAEELEFFIKREGGEMAFESIVAFGERSALPHAKPTERKLRRGDVILIDTGARIDGYCSDITRVFFFGKPDEEILKIYEAVLEAQNSVIEKIKEGMRGEEADSLARESLKEKGYGEHFTHSLGHGVGREVHEIPSLAPGSKEKLRSSTVVTVEPGVYIEGLGGVRIEDMVVISKDTSRNLTKFPKELIIL